MYMWQNKSLKSVNQIKGVDIRAYQPYTLVGPTGIGPVLTPLWQPTIHDPQANFIVYTIHPSGMSVYEFMSNDSRNVQFSIIFEEQ